MVRVVALLADHAGVRAPDPDHAWWLIAPTMLVDAPDVEVVCTSIVVFDDDRTVLMTPAPTRASAIPRIHAPAVTGVTAGPANATVPATIAASVSGRARERDPAGAVVSLAMVSICADAPPFADAAVVSTPSAIDAPPAVSAEM
jgi:hypothetical protein